LGAWFRVIFDQQVNVVLLGYKVTWLDRLGTWLLLAFLLGILVGFAMSFVSYRLKRKRPLQKSLITEQESRKSHTSGKRNS